jgi:hypothetical protein
LVDEDNFKAQKYCYLSRAFGAASLTVADGEVWGYFGMTSPLAIVPPLST